MKVKTNGALTNRDELTGKLPTFTIVQAQSQMQVFYSNFSLYWRDFDG